MSGVPVVRGVNLARGIFHDDDFVFIDSTVADRMPGAELNSGNLVVTHRGTIGQVSMIPRTPGYERYVASTSHVNQAVRLDPKRAVPEYYYWLVCITPRQADDTPVRFGSWCSGDFSTRRINQKLDGSLSLNDDSAGNCGGIGRARRKDRCQRQTNRGRRYTIANDLFWNAKRIGTSAADRGGAIRQRQGVYKRSERHRPSCHPNRRVEFGNRRLNCVQRPQRRG